MPRTGNWATDITRRPHLCTPAKDCSICIVVDRSEDGGVIGYRLIFPYPHYEGVGAPEPVNESFGFQETRALVRRVQEVRGRYTSM